jgi:hypothetical protein
MPSGYWKLVEIAEQRRIENERMKDQPPPDDLACARGILHALMIEGIVAAIIFAGAFYALS